MSKLSLLRMNKLTTIISPKSADKSTSRILIAMVMMTLLLATSSSMVVAPAQATRQILPQLDLPITIPEPKGDADDGGTLVGSVNECFAEHPQGGFALTNCITAAVFDDDLPPPPDPCDSLPPGFPGC